ncbi:nuclear transport factor 2 family protein [Mycolicibacillus trivialis]|uniref:Polyketide cyclase n=1 Tax=Mycolicibacillus trivialis TaxID=1798 RepID=A0A1X2EMH3_9MYCO|nr:nuclear transport factor 2 family protein [Mycolicibacillus trivialis]ORX06798.1 polyketide cyclase [Mycolicibacillus trivialis]
MTSPVITRWLELVEAGEFDGVAAMLADDPVFYSPAVFTPQRGKDTVLAYLSAAGKVFAGEDTGFRYVQQWHGERSAVLEFTATIDGVHVNGVDIIHWGDDEKIAEFKVMLRPIKALQTVIPKMAELLQ